MASRRYMQFEYERRNAQALAVRQHGQLSVGYFHPRQLPPRELLENVLGQQAAELHNLAGENNDLARNNDYLRHNFVATQQEINKLRDHMRIVREKGERRIKGLLDRIATTEINIFRGESAKKELEEARIEEQMLLDDRRVLISKIQQASQELGNAQTDIKMLPDLRAELISLREKYLRKRKKSLEKGDLIIEEVSQMQIMENNLEDMTKEVVRLHTELLEAVRQPNALLEELRHEFVASQQEIEKLKEHIRNIRTEKDTEIGILLVRIAKMESSISAGESIKRELEEAHIEAQNLAAARDDLTSQIHKGYQELDKARRDIKMLQAMVSERDILKQKHKKLW